MTTRATMISTSVNAADLLLIRLWRDRIQDRRAFRDKRHSYARFPLAGKGLSASQRKNFRVFSPDRVTGLLTSPLGPEKRGPISATLASVAAYVCDELEPTCSSSAEKVNVGPKSE